MSNNTDTTQKNSTKTTRRGARRGFTLIEILIVVVILGVLAALVIPGVTSALTDANAKAGVARASQITTMVTRLNQFKPGGASITLSNGTTYSAEDLGALETAGYCKKNDLCFPGETDITAKRWVWVAANSKFEATP